MQAGFESPDAVAVAGLDAPVLSAAGVPDAVAVAGLVAPVLAAAGVADAAGAGVGFVSQLYRSGEFLQVSSLSFLHSAMFEK